MGVSFYTFSDYTARFFEENFWMTSNIQNKKIATIAAIAFGCLILCFLICKCYFKASIPDAENEYIPLIENMKKDKHDKFQERSDKTIEEVFNFAMDEEVDQKDNAQPIETIEVHQHKDKIDDQRKGLQSDEKMPPSIQKKVPVHMLSLAEIMTGDTEYEGERRIMSDGSLAQGEFKDGLLSGKGKRVTGMNGSFQERGIFMNGELCQGTRSYLNPGSFVPERIENGIFTDGALRKGTITIYNKDKSSTVQNIG